MGTPEPVNFDQFILQLDNFGYAIVAMNQFSLNGDDKLYCVIKHRKGNTAYTAEGILENRDVEVFGHLVQTLEFQASI